MKKVLLAVMLVATLVAGGFAISPATVMVGNASVALHESKAKVFFGNAVGNFLGYGHCPITSLSYYWVPITSLEYSPSTGAVFSKYAVNALLTMRDEEEAYQIAQTAFEKLQKEKWGGEKGKKLVHPLKVM